MNSKFVIRKCKKCGATVKVIEDCTCSSGCGISCCGEKMEVLKPNSVDASFEKHIPNYEVIGDEMIVSVNHVMEEEHFIEWICVVYDNTEFTTYFKSGEEPTMKCKYVPGAVIYSYCNKHGLWKKDVE